MSYRVQSSERLRKSGADFETKAMLYLMNFRTDSPEIYYFVVDFFNDITGMDRWAKRLWDVQSKATKSASAKSIGRELVTLYKNYISDFEFYAYIIFMGGVPKTFCKQSCSVFRAENIKEKAYRSLLDGLRTECRDREYIPDKDIKDENLKKFIDQVWFVVDDKKPQDYIKEIIKNHPKIIPSDSELVAIFNEIRNAQSGKKNSLVEGVAIDHIDEVLDYGRHLTASEIRLLVLQRIISNDPLSKGIPEPFMEIYNQYPEESRRTMVQECQSSLCCALFNKSSAQNFWALFSDIYDLVISYPHQDINFIYRKIDGDTVEKNPDFDTLSLKYFIAKIKEGIL